MCTECRRNIPSSYFRRSSRKKSITGGSNKKKPVASSSNPSGPPKKKHRRIPIYKNSDDEPEYEEKEDSEDDEYVAKGFSKARTELGKDRAVDQGGAESSDTEDEDEMFKTLRLREVKRKEVYQQTSTKKPPVILIPQPVAKPKKVRRVPVYKDSDDEPEIEEKEDSDNDYVGHEFPTFMTKKKKKKRGKIIKKQKHPDENDDFPILEKEEVITNAFNCLSPSPLLMDEDDSPPVLEEQPITVGQASGELIWKLRPRKRNSNDHEAMEDENKNPGTDDFLISKESGEISSSDRKEPLIPSTSDRGRRSMNVSPCSERSERGYISSPDFEILSAASNKDDEDDGLEHFNINLYSNYVVSIFNLTD
uniref:BLVR domain-containing protein n=1 Tax=Caenorhabditis tropicalis TaxID=1561998 RepID=A0A1I7TR30_9PELO